MSNQTKRKSVYTEKYKKGSATLPAKSIIEFLKEKGVVVYIVEAGRNDDDTEHLTIKIDGIPQ